jgi:hypothetical protein
MDRMDSRIAGEVRAVEGKEIADSIGGTMGVVFLGEQITVGNRLEEIEKSEGGKMKLALDVIIKSSSIRHTGG